jgi:hypothetical protein
LTVPGTTAAPRSRTMLEGNTATTEVSIDLSVTNDQTGNHITAHLVRVLFM